MKAFCVNEGMIVDLDEHGNCSSCNSSSILPEEKFTTQDKELDLQIQHLKGKRKVGEHE